MIRSQVKELLLKAALMDGRPVSQDVVDAWYPLLRPLDFEQAMAAMMHHFSTEDRKLMPVHIVQGVRRLREEGMKEIIAGGQSKEIPDADPDDVPQYLEAVRQQRFRMGDGVARQQDVLELVEGLGDRLVKSRPNPHRTPTPMVVACRNPVCMAPIGQPCRSFSRNRSPHTERIEDFEAWKAAKGRM